MDAQWIKFIGIGFNILGSMILAFRVTQILSALSLVANCHELSIQQLIANANPIVNMQNSTQHVERAKKKKLLIIGFLCMIIGLVCQGVATYLSLK